MHEIGAEVRWSILHYDLIQQGAARNLRVLADLRRIVRICAALSCTNSSCVLSRALLSSERACPQMVVNVLEERGVGEIGVDLLGSGEEWNAFFVLYTALNPLSRYR